MEYDIKYMGYSGYTIKYMKYIGFGTYPNQFKHIFVDFGHFGTFGSYIVLISKTEILLSISTSSQKLSPGTHPDSSAAPCYIDKNRGLRKTMAREYKILKKSFQYLGFRVGERWGKILFRRSRIIPSQGDQ